MTIIEPQVSRAAIEASVRNARHPGHDPARWALPLIAEVDDIAQGAWALVEFEAVDAGNLWLPPHAGEPCRGDAMWLGPSGSAGSTVSDAATWLLAHEAQYASANPSCWSRIVAARDGDWGPIVVAPFPVGDRTRNEGSALIVIDGLHRTLGWVLARTRAGRVGSARPLAAYVAGPARPAAPGHLSDEA